VSVYDEIRTERKYQDKRWGTQSDDRGNTPWMWDAYIALYSSKWMTGTVAPLDPMVVDAFRKAMVQTAAIAVAAVESLDRQRKADGAAFFEAGGKTTK
jgi:hypothetical protein